jgi:hypothetical protein
VHVRAAILDMIVVALAAVCVLVFMCVLVCLCMSVRTRVLTLATLSTWSRRYFC